MIKKDLSSAETADENGFPLVLIASGLGGSDPVRQLISKLEDETGLYYIYVPFVVSEKITEVVNKLAGAGPLAVEIAKADIILQPDILYVIPPDAALQLDHKKLVRSFPLTGRGYHPIDRFFITAAQQHRGEIVGAILSGSGYDSSSGLRAIKLTGGLTFLEESAGDPIQDVPAAVAAGVVDLVLPAGDIAKEINHFSRQPEIFAETHLGINLSEADDEYLPKIIQLLKQSSTIDFTHYKVSTVKRRIVRRMLQHKLTNLREYYQYLRDHSEEATVLYHDLLINVTCFFRDGDSIEYLRKTILPQIIRSKSSEDQIRIWVPACSTGEEAYTLAILLLEIQEEGGRKIPIQIFATDLDEMAISKARMGVYSHSNLSEISDTRLGNFFTKAENGSYRVAKQIRDMCVFAQHNVFKDPPFSRLDLISCCNLFIYLDNSLQQKCAAIFNYALNPSGFLVLGKSETISGDGLQMLTQVERRFKVYKKKADAPIRPNLSGTFRTTVSENADGTESKGPGAQGAADIAGLEKMVDDLLYSRYIPPAVVINRDMDILQFRGSTNLVLEPARGKASLNLLKMAKSALVFDLRNCIHKAQISRKPERKSGIELSAGQQKHEISIEVVPLHSGADDRLMLVIFEEITKHQSGWVEQDLSGEERVRKLEKELEIARADMQAIIDDHEAGKEELQSANEEIISSNEELQSINEELETSKEEVESINEELTAINTELKLANAQLLQSQQYSDAIFQTIREAMVVVDTEVRIKVANAAFHRIFRLQGNETQGRMLYDLGSGQWRTSDIRGLLNEILLQNRQFENHEISFDMPGVGIRKLMVNSRKVIQFANNEELILLAFEDVTEARHAEVLKAEREEWFQHMANNAPVMIWMAGVDGERNFFNTTWLQYTGKAPEEELVDGWVNDVMPEDRDRFLAIYRKSFREERAFDFEYRLRRHDGIYRWVRAVGKPTFSTDGHFTGFVGICTEIHDAKIAQSELEALVQQRTHDLQQSNKELHQSNAELQQFAYVASHDLQEPLRKIMMFSDRLTTTIDIGEAAFSYVRKIEDSTKRMSQLINDLLDFSRATRSSKPFEVVDLNKIVRSSMTDLDHIIKEKAAVIICEDLPVIKAIPIQIEQLFLNLISNALKFTKENVAPVVQISARVVDRAEDDLVKGLNPSLTYSEIIIADNGIGFGNEFADQIFILFQRLNARNAYPGTGIGLALCKKIVENHGGRIFATSKEFVHTEFHILLPVLQDE